MMTSLLERLTRRILTGQAADGSYPYAKKGKGTGGNDVPDESGAGAGAGEEAAGDGVAASPGLATAPAAAGEGPAAASGAPVEEDTASLEPAPDGGRKTGAGGGAGAYADGSTWRLVLDDAGREWEVPEEEGDPSAVISAAIIDRRVLVDPAAIPGRDGAAPTTELDGAAAVRESGAQAATDGGGQDGTPGAGEDEDTAEQGEEVRTRLPRLCTGCWGSGQVSTGAVCPACQGVAEDWCEGMSLVCTVCHGTGRVNLPCPTCEGRGWLHPDEITEERPRPSPEEVNAALCPTCGTEEDADSNLAEAGYALGSGTAGFDGSMESRDKDGEGDRSEG